MRWKTIRPDMEIRMARSCCGETNHNICGALMWASCDEVARGHALPSPGGYCPCNFGAIHCMFVMANVAQMPGMIALMGMYTCSCLRVSAGICEARPVWNWEPLQRCVGGDLNNEKAGTKRFAVVKVVPKSLAPAQADAGNGSAPAEVSESSRTKIAASDFSHRGMMTSTIRFAGVGHGSRLWMSEHKLQACGMIAPWGTHAAATSAILAGSCSAPSMVSNPCFRTRFSMAELVPSTRLSL